MSWFRYLLLTPVVGAPLLLAGALKHPPDPVVSAQTVGRLAPADPVGPSAPEDVVGTEMLDQAIETLNPNRVEWLEAEVWQQVSCQDLTYQAEGHFRAAPGQRLRLQLGLRVGRVRGDMQVVSDGITIWQAQQVDSGPRLVHRVELQAFLNALAQPDLPPAQRAELLQHQGFAGLAPLLQGLRHRLVVTGRENLSWKGQPVTRLTLIWPASPETLPVSAGQPWPALVPRKCLLYLDARSFWPHRLEWWGPEEAAGRDRLLFEMEFRNPVVNRPLTPEQCAREFTFDAQGVIVQDRTFEVDDS
jgi:hypothetical protein